MYQTFFQTICRVGVFLICAQAILHFGPREIYVKYLKFLVSAMVLIQLALPFGSFLLGGRREELARALEQFKQDMESSVRQAEENAARADSILEQMTLEEVRRAAEAQSGQKKEEIQKDDELRGDEAVEKNMEEDGGMGQSEIEVKVEVEAVEPVRPGRE